jgi:ATP/maltotriose-dependent transcriptional regulator MalT
MRHTKGELGRARDELTRAVGLARDVGDRALLVQAEHLSGHVDYALGDLPSARARLTRTAEEFRTLAMPWGTGNALAGLASVALATGDADEALRLLDEATSVLQHAGPWFLMPVLYVRAILAVRRGHADPAIALVRENLTRIRELNDRFAFVYALIPLAAAAVLKGEDVWAARILGARDAVLERSGVTIVETPVDDLRNQAERQARERLGPDKWVRSYEAGRKTAIDSADDLARFVAAGPR